MTDIRKRYESAVRSSNLKHSRESMADGTDPVKTASRVDVIGAVGFAGKKRRTEIVDGKIVTRPGAPLGVALMRLFAGDDREARNIVQLLTNMMVGKAWHFYRLELPRVEAEDIARAVLAWHRDGVCRVCGGHGYQVVGGKLGEGRAVISDAECGDCHGTSKVPFDRHFSIERLAIARWLRDEIEWNQAIAGVEAMKALGPRL